VPPETALDELVPPPGEGRVFTATRRVRLGDSTPDGRLRLDALARLLQDVGNDDFVDAGLDVTAPWVARRMVAVADPWPRLGEQLTFRTFCGGLGSRWAERRTSVRGDGGGAVEVAALWVFVDPASGRPARLPDWFVGTYGPAARGRTVSARQQLPRPPEGARSRPWPLRHTDLDVLGHVNNAATWAAVEDELGERGLVPGRAELEYGAAIEHGDPVELLSAAEPDGGADDLLLWLTVDADVRASARVTPAG
jgi:acyl-ACP thioesterase